jgi:hypothetical protein
MAQNPVVRRGSSGESVRLLQQLLTDRGHSPGPVDGIFGPGTEAAVRAFQQANGLAVDGVVGPNTWTALGQASAPVDPTPPADRPARALTRDEARAELERLQDETLILFAPSSMAGKVDLDGMVPGTGAKEDGNVAGVRVRYLESGSRLSGQPGSPSAPDRLDPRHALAIVRFCRWLNEEWGATELYHLGTSADSSGKRVDCHGQGRAMDFVGIKGNHDGADYFLTVREDWGTVDTPSTPRGVWQPAGTSSTHYRLADVEGHDLARDFFSAAYDFIADQWQDRSAHPDPAGPKSSIGQRTFIMNPDHPTSAPSGKGGRESHANHLHMQIGPTGTES